MSLAHGHYTKHRTNIFERLRREQRAPKVDLKAIRPRDPKTGKVLPYEPRKNLKPIPAVGAHDPAPRRNREDETPTGFVQLVDESGNRYTRVQPPDDIIDQFEQRPDAIGKLRWFHKETGQMFRATPTRNSITGCTSPRRRRRSGELESTAGAETENQIDLASSSSENEDDTQGSRYTKRAQPGLGSPVGMIFDTEVWSVEAEDHPMLRAAGRCKNPNIFCEEKPAPGQSYCPQCRSRFFTTSYVSERPARTLANKQKAPVA